MSGGESARRLAPRSAPSRAGVGRRAVHAALQQEASRRPARPARSGAARRPAAAARSRRSACGRSRRAPPAAPARRSRPPCASGSSMAASSSRSSVSSARTVTPTMPWPADGTIASGSSTTRRAILQPQPAQPGERQQRRGAVAGGDAGRAGVCTLPRSSAMRRSGRACSSCACRRSRGRADHRAAGQARRTGRRDRAAGSRGRGSARRARPRAAACRPARCRAAARFPGPSGCARRSRSARRPAPRGSPWRTAPCRRYRRGGGPAPRRRWCGSACSSNTSQVAQHRAELAEPARKARVCTSASGEPRVPTRSGSRPRCGRTPGGASLTGAGRRPCACPITRPRRRKDRIRCRTAAAVSWASRAPATRPPPPCSTATAGCWPRLVLSQEAEHAPFGGVVPEIAARAHLAHLPGLVREVMDRAGVGFAALGGVAASAGPGLIGGLIVGSRDRQGHRHRPGPALRRGEPPGGARADRPAARPGAGRGAVSLPAAAGLRRALPVRRGGGRRALSRGSAARWTTRRARRSTRWQSCSGCRWPGGPALERLAAAGDPARYAFPRPMLGRPGCDFSFSGLKTAVAQEVGRHQPGALDGQVAADIAA